MTRRVVSVSIGAFTASLLLYNVGSSLCRRDLPREAAARYFADLSIGANLALTGDFPVAAYTVKGTSIPRHDEGFTDFRRRLVQAVGDARLSCWHLFGAIPRQSLPDVQRLVSRADDPGRGLLLGTLFKPFGIAPFLLFWLAPVACALVFLWTAWELSEIGHEVAAAILLILVSTSAYVTDSLALDYSAVGFYVTALLLLIPPAAYAIRPLRRRTLRGVLNRAALAGPMLGMCAIARSASLVVAPFIFATLAYALRGIPGDRTAIAPSVPGIGPQSSRLRRVSVTKLVAVLAAALLSAPYLALRTYTNALVTRTSVKYGVEVPTQAHDVWLSVWEGLGDFDRTKGHFWLDERAKLLVGQRLLMTPESERIFRGAVIRDITGDPVWFGEILLKRLATVLLQRKLWPWRPVNGISMAPQKAPNEGATDTYYSLVATADTFGVGGCRLEVPIQLPLLAFLLLMLRTFVRFVRGSADSLCAPALLVVLLATSSMVLPVVVTTAGGIEPQAFVLAYLLSVAFLLETLGNGIQGHGRTIESGTV